MKGMGFPDLKYLVVVGDGEVWSHRWRHSYFISDRCYAGDWKIKWRAEIFSFLGDWTEDQYECAAC